MVSDPEQPAAAGGPACTRVEEATPLAWTTVLTSPKGKSVRADYTRVDRRAADAARLAPGGRGVALRAHPGRGDDLARAGAAEGDGTRVAIELDQKPRGWARFAPLQFRAAGTRQVQGALDGLREAVRMRWWGWGEDGHDAPLPEPRSACCAPSSASTPARRRPPVALEEVRLPEARARPAPCASGWRAVVGEEHVLDDRAARVEHAAGRSYPDLVRLRSGELGGAPDAVVEPGSAERGAARCSPPAREARVAVVPFGGGTSVVGGVEPLADGFRGRRSRSTCAASTGCSTVDRTSLTATLEAGLFGPEAERRLAARGRDARPLPAVVRVLDRRRLGGDPLGRPGLDRLRADRRAGRGAAAASRRPARSTRRAGAGHRRRARPARAARGLRGRARA